MNWKKSCMYVGSGGKMHGFVVTRKRKWEEKANYVALQFLSGGG